MAEYIERAAICKACKDSGAECTGRDCEIPYIPVADVAEVVRCKDCKYRADRLYCRLRKTPYIVTNLDFCSYGEPLEG